MIPLVSALVSTLAFSNFGSHASSLERSYPNGDIYFLAGRLAPEIVRDQASAFLEATPELTRLGFRTLINLTATVCDLQEALANPRLKVIVWTSHGVKSRGLIDHHGFAVPTRTFRGLGRRGSDKGRVHIVMNACFAKAAFDRYHDKAKMPFITWAYYNRDDGGREGQVYSYHLSKWLRTGGLAERITEIFADDLRERCSLSLIGHSTPKPQSRKINIYNRRRRPE